MTFGLFIACFVVLFSNAYRLQLWAIVITFWVVQHEVVRNLRLLCRLENKRQKLP